MTSQASSEKLLLSLVRELQPRKPTFKVLSSSKGIQKRKVPKTQLSAVRKLAYKKQLAAVYRLWLKARSRSVRKAAELHQLKKKFDPLTKRCRNAERTRDAYNSELGHKLQQVVAYERDQKQMAARLEAYKERLRRKEVASAEPDKRAGLLGAHEAVEELEQRCDRMVEEKAVLEAKVTCLEAKVHAASGPAAHSQGAASPASIVQVHQAEPPAPLPAQEREEAAEHKEEHATLAASLQLKIRELKETNQLLKARVAEDEHWVRHPMDCQQQSARLLLANGRLEEENRFIHTELEQLRAVVAGQAEHLRLVMQGQARAHQLLRRGDARETPGGPARERVT
jgi:hypothetical protein